MAPALVAELVLLIKTKKGFNVLHFVVSCSLANITGTFLTVLVFFAPQPIFLFYVLAAAAFSGAVGGAVGYMAYKGILKTGALKRMNFSKKAKPKDTKITHEVVENEENS
jgi:hypothetical protein